MPHLRIAAWRHLALAAALLGPAGPLAAQDAPGFCLPATKIGHCFHDAGCHASTPRAPPGPSNC